MHLRISPRSVLVGALATAALAGCSVTEAPSPGRAPQQAQEQARAAEAIAAGEAAVLLAPHSAGARTRLGTAYLAAGRFASAAAVFADAVALGDASAGTALRLALALTGSGQAGESAVLLFARGDALPATDLGLALAMAGEAEAAVRILERAIREGEQGISLRQNLALAYALDGRWREARVMASFDLPADQIGRRMEHWAGIAVARHPAQRLALLLRVPADAEDPGLPVTLALASPEPALVSRQDARLSEPIHSAPLAPPTEPPRPKPIRLVLPTFPVEPAEPASTPLEAVQPAQLAVAMTEPDALRPRTAPRRRHLHSPRYRP